MAELSIKHRRRGLEFANALASLATKAPDDTAKSVIYAGVQQLRLIYGFNDEAKQDLIAKAVGLGCSTYDDLANETKLDKRMVREMVAMMVDAGILEVRMLTTTAGRAGRPPAFIKLRQ